MVAIIEAIFNKPFKYIIFGLVHRSYSSTIIPNIFNLPRRLIKFVDIVRLLK